MTSHELAKILLEMPDLPVQADAEVSFNPRMEAVVDCNHPDFKECDIPDEDRRDENGFFTPVMEQWFDAQPKMNVITI